MIFNYDVSEILKKIPDDQVHNLADVVSRVGSVGDYIPILVGTDTTVTNALCGSSASGIAIFKGVGTRIDFLCTSAINGGVIECGTIDKATATVTLTGFDHINFENQAQIYDNANTIHLHTPPRSNGSYAQYTLEPDGKLAARLTTDDGDTWTSWITMADTTEKAPLASPTFTGSPKAPTKSTSDDSTNIATTAFVHDVADGLLTVKSFTSTATAISAGSAGNASISCTSSGYTPLVIGGITKSGTGSSHCVIYEFFMDGNNARVYFRNVNTSDASITVTVKVLMLKT